MAEQTLPIFFFLKEENHLCTYAKYEHIQHVLYQYAPKNTVGKPTCNHKTSITRHKCMNNKVILYLGSITQNRIHFKKNIKVLNTEIII